jgi:23S rRNA G2445 N2-methylase RlmL
VVLGCRLARAWAKDVEEIQIMAASFSKLPAGGRLPGSAQHGPPPLPSPAAPRYLALCAHMIEPLVAAELRALPEVTDVQQGPGQVSFAGPRAALYRANLHLRCASRVVQLLSDTQCAGPDDLYAAARAIPWEEFLQPDGTLAVSARGLLPGIDNSMYAALRVKDAVCDRFRDRYGVRPGVDVRQPKVRINVQLYDGGDARSAGREGRYQALQPRCALSLDSSDPALHQRGYRQGGGEAPLKETLAAAIIALTGYPELAAKEGEPATGPTGGAAGELPPLVDLCCGSGTLLCEGGLRALGLAPGLARQFGFMTWRDFDAALWQRLQREARQQQRGAAGPFLFGADRDGKVLHTAQRSLEAAGLMRYSRLACGDLREAEPPPGPPGVVVCNPPYGERLGQESELVELYRGLGDTLKRRFVGYTAYVFTANLALGRQIGLRPSARHVLYNANLEGRLLQFKLY